MPRFSSDEIDRIRRHRKDTIAFILLDDDNCFGLRPSDFTKIRGRRLVPVRPDELPVDPLPPSWVLVVLTCPDDDLTPVAAWASKLRRPDLHRVWFYELETHDASASYQHWIETGLPYPRRERVKDTAEFNRIFANELNIRILLDHGLS